MQLRIASLLFVAAACGDSSTVPNALSIDVLSAARPASAVAVRNHTNAAIALFACDTSLFAVAPKPSGPVVYVDLCTHPTTVTLAAGASVTRSIATPVAGQWSAFVRAPDLTTLARADFTVP